MARVNLYEELYEKLIQDRGIDCLWERAVVCCCLHRDSGQPDFNCPICGGSGYRYLDPKSIRIAVTGLSSDYKLDTIMLREPGTAYITPKADVIMGYHDRVKFPDFKCTFSEAIHWDNEENGFGVSPKMYRDIKDVIFLADDTMEYEKGIDFEVTEDLYHIHWLNEELAKEADHKDMSILYYTTPSYIVSDLLHEIRATISDRNTPNETFRELPKQYRIVREDFIYKVKTPDALKETVIDGEESSEPIDTGDGITI